LDLRVNFICSKNIYIYEYDQFKRSAIKNLKGNRWVHPFHIIWLIACNYRQSIFVGN